MQPAPARGLPPRIYLPVLAAIFVVFALVIGYFLKVGLRETGAALGPAAEQGDARIQASAPPQAAVAAPETLPSAGSGEEVVPQSGGAPGEAVGGGTPQQAAAGPPAPIARLLADLRSRLARNPNDLAALVSLAQLYFDAGKFAQAIPYYKRALALDPQNPDSRTDYATALHNTGQDLAALDQIGIVLRANPRFPAALFNEGVIANAIGRHSQAIAAFQTFLKVAPNDERAPDARTALHNLGAD